MNTSVYKYNKFRTVLKVENYIHPGGVGYITPPEKYLLHDREILSVFCLTHFESLYHVIYFFGFLDCSKFLNIFIVLQVLKYDKFRTVLKVEKYIHPGGVGYITPQEKYLLHDREILNVLCLRHCESLYLVFFWFSRLF